jgi:hypothetical protein
MPKDLIELCFETPLTWFLASWEPWLNLETALAPQERDMTNSCRSAGAKHGHPRSRAEDGTLHQNASRCILPERDQ